jgi:hypothetical protein
MTNHRIWMTTDIHIPELANLAISRDILVRADFYPEVGDIVFWDNEYYEIDNVDCKSILCR